MRFSEHSLIMIQPMLAKYLEETAYQSLNDFVTIYWAVIESKSNMNRQWKKRRTDIYDGWYDCQYESRYISIDCISGTFLVYGMTIGFLPETITSNELFVRVFDDYVFEVQAAKLPNTYITKHAYHGNRRVRYEFHFNDHAKHLTITERHEHTHEIWQLIPHSCFFTELPDIFVSNHSHWWNAKDRIIEFRPIHFRNTDFLDNKPYVLSMKTGYVTTTRSITKQILLNQTSYFFQSLFNKYFSRLDDKPFVYMMKDNTSRSDMIIHIHLSRLGIAFKYNANSKTITSREYFDMCIEENQWLGTLTGLKSGLLLSPLPINNQRLENYPYRKLIVPFGQINGEITSSNNHQIVTVNRSSLSAEFVHYYFVFIMNDRLKILQSTDSPTGWLYLALLHAMTSYPLPDQYTGISGMERAFQLLNSAGCWSDQPFGSLSLNILGQIAAISPRVNYYPTHLTCMEQVDWNSNGVPYSLQHFGYYLLAKNLIETSERFSFMYSSSIIVKKPKIFKENLYNETLLRKLYWNYRDLYNPLARLSAEMESDILHCANSKPYKMALKHCSYATNYFPIRLVDDLYNNGNVNLIDCSRQKWLPLSQWLIYQNQFNTIWIGLLKMIDCIKASESDNSQDEIERFDKLVDFLHYVSDKLKIKPFYLQMLKTVLRNSTVSLKHVSIPPFIIYQNIEEVSIVRERINLSNNYSLDKMSTILVEVNNAWSNNHDYQDKSNLVTSTDKTRINQLLKSWKNNLKLRTFLESIQDSIGSFAIQQFVTKVSSYPQEFLIESIKNHYRIEVKRTNTLINHKLLSNAAKKFHYLYSDYFNKPRAIRRTIKLQNEFFNQIFPVINNHQNNSLNEITDYFKNQLNKSWEKFLADELTQKENPSVEEIVEYLNYLREETICGWNELIRSITDGNEHLFKIGLVTRITPNTLVSSYYHQNVERLDLTTDQQTLLGGILVNWTLEQQLERAMRFAIHNKWDDFTNEISNIPHSNWIPSEHVPWLILELEMNITIREIQIKVARHMMQPNMNIDDNTIKNIVIQMNMGEGKTSVILPMLAVSLCSSSSASLVRIIVLKSLFTMNYQSLRYKLGGLLNRRVFSFACRRDMKFDAREIEQIDNRFKQALCNCDVILTSPEDILSFDLLTIDKCRRNEFELAPSMLRIQQWMQACVRDVLDESDEILDVKYQLIYTVGDQREVDGGAERWKTIQSILDLVKKHAATIANDYTDEVCYKPSERKSAFPQLRLQSSQPFSLLCEKIAKSWIKNRNYPHVDRKCILSFIVKTHSSIKHIIDKFPHSHIQLFLIVRGLLSSEVLLFALRKRYRVNYGINRNSSFNRLMAVPFRAKDVAADKTEFGHPDIALILTQLSYYYSGLNDEQLLQCLNYLNEKETDPSSIYDQWISYEEKNDIPSSIEQWKGINLKDYQQRTSLIFPTLQYNMLVINYFLNHFVFPREAKQFSHKLAASAWDLSSSARSKIISGFSGTNDTQLLLPIHIRQYDIPELQKTDAIVIDNLLRPTNEFYQPLPINATSNDILNEITNYKEMINVILDVGALFIDGTNRDTAIKWLNLSNKNQIDYAVYFDSDAIVVCDRQYHHYRFETSPASERLDHCVFYIDEIHTRGTDFKFPNGFKAAVTLGNGLTKDRFVQASMRMRKLGNGHSLTFWSSNEIHRQIKGLKQNLIVKNLDDSIKLIDILRWVYDNTIQSIWNGLHHWATQSLNFQRKVAAFKKN